MHDSGILIVGADDVGALLAGREQEVMDTVGRAYRAHGAGQSSLPHSTFLRFPNDDTNRIIALPAFLGDGFQVAGMKWIASFPGNLQRGMARASAVMVLNSCETGHPEAILEGSLISAERTAASAALAARVFLDGRPPEAAGFIGAGLINRAIARFLAAALPEIGRLRIFDLDPERAAGFARDVPGAEVAASLEEILRSCPLVSFATTAIRPHVDDLSACPPGAVILHVSLRDLSPQVILGCDNVVDDADHVARAQTSIHLAEQLSGSRGFIRCTLAEILEGTAPPRADGTRVTVFSPFGLGILDVAVGKLVLDRARRQGRGTEIRSFLPI
ncbi:MAG TPA: 2,3-diaminopropionate biosynthesis protein SbnB [Thermoanaerobaculia bacterium]|nr:2,3-diaminopropionate biosynthesis protein SbnB [Thermoanaerobaculia bacterium]